jgi:ribonuclease HII
MSSLAGPVAAAAVIFAPGSRRPGVDDSKKLDAASRQRLSVEIKAAAIASVAFADVEKIDSINIYWASRLAMRRAIEGLARRAEHVLVDGPAPQGVGAAATAHHQGRCEEPDHRRCLDPGENRAGRADVQAGHRPPRLRVRKTQGISMPEHRAALGRLGACAIHRRSFAPVRTVLGLPPLPLGRPPSVRMGRKKLTGL